MRSVFRRVPSQEDVRREVRRAARKWKLPAPDVLFHKEPDGLYDEPLGRLRLPDPEWVLEGQPDLRGERYWCLVAHELGHYVSDKCYGKPYHNPTMYVTVLSIVLAWDLPLDEFYIDEHSYCPNAFRGGRALASRLLTQSLASIYRPRET